MTTTPGLAARPHRTAGQCTLPAVGTWTTYPRSTAPDASVDGVRAFPFCRHHRAGAVHSMALDFAAAQPTPHYVHHGVYEEGQSAVGCAGPAIATTEAAAADASRILAAQEQVRRGLAQLTALTTNTFGVSAYIGNEHAVLEALTDLADDLEREFEVVRTRIGHRSSVPPREDGTCCVSGVCDYHNAKSPRQLAATS